MKIVSIVCTLALFSLSTQAQTLVPASMRTAYCTDHANDSFNCTFVKTQELDGTSGRVGLPRLCPGLSDQGQSKKRKVASWLTPEGVDDESFEKMGLCKLSDDELSAFIRYKLTLATYRDYFDTDARQAKKIYVSLEAGSNNTPDIIISEFRNALRSIPDVELTKSPRADFHISVETFQAKISGSPVGYTISVELVEMYEMPDGLEKRKLRVLLFDSLATTGVDSFGETIRDDVAHFNNKQFEDFRGSWPYRK